MRLIRRPLFALLIATACSADPLPQPPLVETERLRVLEIEGGARIQGGPMALRDPDGADLFGDARVRSMGASGRSSIAADGAFSVDLPGTSRTDVFALEYVGPDADVYLLSFTSVAGGAIMSVDPGPDRDADGSPDALDCAPDDRTRRGEECVCMPEPERCNGLDDDCDAAVDETCVVEDVCGNGVDDDLDGRTDESCASADLCGNALDDDGDGFVDEGCSTCASDADCLAGERCVDGACQL